MPAKNVVKQYVEEGYYHIYNRGVEKRSIFQDQQDYSVFISYLKTYLTPKDSVSLMEQLANPRTPIPERDGLRKQIRMNNFADDITLLAYCLMPNHFHLLVKQKSAGAIDKFMNSLGTRYTMYFNKKYKRVGALYQGTYKAVLVQTDAQLLELSRYIHKQSFDKYSLSGQGQPSSYPAYLGSHQGAWVKPDEILAFFSQTNPKLSYKSFVGQTDNNEISNLIYPLVIEE